MLLKHQQIKWISILCLLAFILWDVAIDIPFWMYLIPLLIYVIPVNLGSSRIQSQFFVPAICQANTNQQFIALSFDDGPTTFTPEVLAVLKHYDIPATFFCIGKQIEEHPEILLQITKEGHTIGNHSYSHSYSFGFFAQNRVKKELQRTDALIQQVIDHRPKWFRPPFGVTNPMIAAALKKTEHTVIGWNVRSLDTVIKEERKVVNRIIKQLKPGAIVLLHDRHDRIVPILKQLIPRILEADFKVVPLEELVKNHAYVRL